MRPTLLFCHLVAYYIASVAAGMRRQLKWLPKNHHWLGNAVGPANIARREQALLGDTSFKYYTQKVDHYAGGDDGDGSATFNQRYLINSKYAEGSHSPIILFLVGEQGITEADAHVQEVTNIAKLVGGTIVCLELRYYGESYPVPDMSAPNMRYLTTKQILADIVNFVQNPPGSIRSLADDMHRKWIAIGTSYAGSLVAWLTLEEPEMVVAGIASSAPINPKQRFDEFDQTVGRVFPCSKSLARAVRVIDQIMDDGHDHPDRVALLKSTFGFSEYLDDSDFVVATTDQISRIAQTNVPVKGDQGTDAVQDFCDRLSEYRREQEDSPLASDSLVSDPDVVAYAKVTRSYLDSTVGGNLSAYNSTDGAGDVSLGQDDRAWLWQACTELGLWQVAPKKAPRYRSKRVNLEYFQSRCELYFDSDPAVIDKHPAPAFIDQIFKQHDQPSVSPYLLFTNGENDPWRWLSVSPPSTGTDDTNRLVLDQAFSYKSWTRVIIAKGSHGMDFRQIDSKQWPPLAKARSTIEKFVQERVDVKNKRAGHTQSHRSSSSGVALSAAVPRIYRLLGRFFPAVGIIAR